MLHISGIPDQGGLYYPSFVHSWSLKKKTGLFSLVKGNISTNVPFLSSLTGKNRRRTDPVKGVAGRESRTKGRGGGQPTG
jgi:hypothetical protein